MRQHIKNPFYIVLGIIGFTFTITAASYCLSVLRGIRPQETLSEKSHPLEEIMDVYGTSLLAGQLIILAIATVGAVAVDQPQWASGCPASSTSFRDQAASGALAAHQDQSFVLPGSLGFAGSPGGV